MKILFPVDGSSASRNALRFALRHWAALAGGESPTILFVDAPLLAGARRKLGAKAVARYHSENARAAFRAARAQLARGGVAAEERILAAASPGAEIARFAEQGGFELIVMGSRGQGAFGTFLLGSVANKVLARCRVPVLLVR